MEDVSEIERSHNTERNDKSRPKVDLNILYVRHTPENVGNILPSLKDADIIAMEYILDSPTARDKVEGLANDITQDESGSLENTIVSQFVHDVVEAERGSGKAFRFIDTDKTEPIHWDGAIVEQVDALRETFLPATNVEDLLQSVDIKARHAAEYASLRESLMAQQLKQLIDEQRENVKIAVVVGAAHTPISKRLQGRLGANTTINREFIDGQSELAVGTKAQFSPDVELKRHYAFHPEQPANRHLLLKVAATRQFLVDTYLKHGEEHAILSPEKWKELDGYTDEQLVGLVQADIDLSKELAEHKRRKRLDTARQVIDQSDPSETT